MTEELLKDIPIREEFTNARGDLTYVMEIPALDIDAFIEDTVLLGQLYAAYPEIMETLVSDLAPTDPS